MRKLTQEEFLTKLKCTNQYFARGDGDIIGEYTNRRTKVQCRCHLHDIIWSEFPENLYRGYRCPKCDNRKNDDASGDYCQIKTFGDRLDLWTTHPHIAKLLKDPQDGYRYTHGSAKKLEFVCPDCGASRTLTLNGVVHYGFSCLKCSDCISFPNKYSRALLDQVLGDNYECEYQPDWAKPYFYDNYFEYNGNKYILEMDGAYHYIEHSACKKSLVERQKDDAIKDELALSNNVNIIRIDCSTPEADFIKEQILQSRLVDIFDLSNIDWNMCNIKAQKNLVQSTCELYMSGLYAPVDICRLLHICRDSLIKYLKIGAKIGWCNYDPEQTKTYPKAVAILDDNDNVLHSFYGLRECVRRIKEIYNVDLFRHYIVRACTSRHPYKGFNFRFLNDLHNTMIDIKEVI